MPDYTVDIRLVFDNGPELPVDLRAPFTIKMVRGMNAYMFSLATRDITGFPSSSQYQKGAKCKFVFRTPGESGGRVEAEWQLYLVRVEPGLSEPGIYKVTFADERWIADYERHSLSYNVQWPDGSYRADTTPGGFTGKESYKSTNTNGSPWKAVDAFVDAVTKFGYTPDVSRVPASKRNILLPNNLGNSDGGGWCLATWSEIVKPMLAAIDCDLVINNKRKWFAVPRTGDDKKQLASLRAMKRIDDTVAVGANGWERPRKLRVGFEIMAEAAIESEITDDPRQTASSFSTLPLFDVPDNVMPRQTAADLDPEAWWEAQVGELADTDWTILNSELSRLGYTSDAEAMICRNYFLPQVIPFNRKGEFKEIVESTNPTENAIAIEKKLWACDMIREHWRRTYRIVFPTSSTDAFATTLRALSGIRMGRLTPGGDSRSRGSVYCDWSEETTHAVNPHFSSPLNSVFSANHKYSSTTPAPFTARWVAQSGNELIYQIEPQPATRIGQARLFPGLFNQELNYGTWFNMTSDGYLEQVEMHGTFQQGFDYRIYMSGLLAMPDPRQGVQSSYGQIEGRQLIVEVPLFPEGSIDSLDVALAKLTANYGYAKAQMAKPLGQLAMLFPASLLNESDIRSAVDRATAIAKETFALENSGGINIAGVSPLAQDLMTDGDIHEMSIVVGDPDPWSIKSQYIVMPGVSGMTLEPVKRDGEKPALIAQSD